MPIPIAMPKLGMTMREGRVIEWLPSLGERVAKGQVVLLIETDKAEAEVEAPASGVLRHIYVGAGETVPCATLLAALTETADEPFDPESYRREHERQSPPGAAAPSPVRAGPGVPQREDAAAAETVPRVSVTPVTPAARRRAGELGIDPASVPGSGPGGRVMREDVETYAELLGARVAVAEGVALEVPAQGVGEPVVLLPGFGTDVSSFARQVPALAERYRVLGVNPRGVGFSDAPEAERYDVATAAADVAAVVADNPAHVVGASLGAAVALEVALMHPECVRSLALVTPFVRLGPRLRAVIEAWCRLAAEASPETLARALVPWLYSPAFLTDEVRRERAVRGLAQTVVRVPALALARAAAGLYAWSGSREGDMGRLSVPTLVVAGGEDLLTPGAEAIAAAITGASCVVIQQAGHAVALEAPEAVNEALLRHMGAVAPLSRP